jgi:3-hydroxyisobutyrate dehydrogenase-like beta-hydroxyacid dehydrogenase
MANVTVLGLGAMGSRMALSLLEAGHAVTVWNRNPARTASLIEKGARAAGTPAEAVAEAEFALSMVRDVEASSEVWLAPQSGALAALPAGAIAAESSTITVEWARALAGAFAAQDKLLIDAPVSGSRKQADAKELIFLVGGPAAAVERATPILLAIGKLVQHMGPAGAGTAMKLMVNASMAAQLAAVVELLGMAERLGIGAEQAMEVYNSTAVASPWIKANAPALLARDYAPQFAVELIEKDLNYALAAAATAGAQVPVTQAAQRAYAAALAQGLSEQNMTALAEVYRPA